MYSKKSVGPIMGPWRTPALTGYSCEDFPSRTTQRCLLLRKEEIRLHALIILCSFFLHGVNPNLKKSKM